LLGGGARHAKCAPQVGLHHAVPVVVLHPHEKTVARDAGVVHEDVEASEALLRRVDESVAVLAARRIGDDGGDRDARRFEVLGGALEAVGVAAGNDHGRAGLGQQPGDGGADASTATGDDGHAAGQRRVAHAVVPAALNALSSPVGSSMATPRAPSTIRLTSALSTRPAASATARSTAARWPAITIC